MSPQEVQERLKLSQLKDKIWYVVPSCATTGEGLFEGLVSLPTPSRPTQNLARAGKQANPETIKGWLSNNVKSPPQQRQK